MKKITLAALALSAFAPFHAFAQLTIARTSAPGNDATGSQAISGDGKFHAFASASNNLVGSDSNGASDIFVRNLATSAIEYVSRSNVALGNSASKNPSISSNGRFVAFQSLANNLVSLDTN